jgi:hypothetical protein
MGLNGKWLENYVYETMKMVIVLALLQILCQNLTGVTGNTTKTFSQVSCTGAKTQIQDNPNMDHRSYHLTMTYWCELITLGIQRN